MDDDVALVTVALPDPVGDEVLVQNRCLSVEPYMRGRMSDVRSYVEPYSLGAAMTGHAVGQVVKSSVAALPVGSWVLHEQGWRDVALVPAEDATPIDVSRVPAAAYLGVLGLTGMTAWVGLIHIARCRPGDVVFVSAAAGAVGSTAVQIAKGLGCKVIGSAGSAEKVRHLVEELGCDAAFSHLDTPIRASLAAAMAAAGVEGLDVYFDNVGGEQLEAAIREMRPLGRIALCGAISVYNAAEPVPGPRNLLLMIWRRLRMEGFLVGDHEQLRPDFERDMTRWLTDGTVHNVETPYEGGIEQAWLAFLAMLGGENVGKMLVPLPSQ